MRTIGARSPVQRGLRGLQVAPASAGETAGPQIIAPSVWILENFVDPQLAARVRRFLSNPSEQRWHVAESNSPKYRFRRAEHLHKLSLRCPLCRCRDVFDSPAVRRKLSRLSGRSDLVLVEIFASCFSRGDFLATHTDAGKGAIAFSWSLTPHWRRDYGGNLHLLSRNLRTSEVIVTPRFNRLVAFDVSGDGRPHAVSKVKVSRRRFAITGWYANDV